MTSVIPLQIVQIIYQLRSQRLFPGIEVDHISDLYLIGISYIAEVMGSSPFTPEYFSAT